MEDRPDSEPVAARPESIYDAFVNASARDAVFDPAQSPLYERVGFIVGAPRSGTTWLQQLLYVHPDVVTAGESHLFCEGLPEVFANFAHPNGMSHLSTWVSRPELLSAARAFCDRIFATQRDGTRPDASFIIEKTPNHRLQSRLQAELYPDARYVHIVRDGRDATASQRQLWAADDAEFADPARAATAWADAIHDIRANFGALAFLEIRYEDVVADPNAALRRIFEHFDLAYDAALIDAAVTFGRAPVHASPQSPHVGVRKHAGDVLAERAVAQAAGDLLVELGYATPDEVERLRRLRTPRPRRIGRRRRDAEPEVRTAVSALADSLVNEDPVLSGARLTQRRIVGDSALLTFVTAKGERVVLRAVVTGGVAAVVESL